MIRAQWPIVTVAAIFAVALVLVAAGLRLLLPEDRAGLLAVRSKSLDFATMTTLSVVMIYTAWTIDPLGTS